ncbi:hypothetical protein ILYODFUR_032722 [Ilyodon furcidens]|uniref:trypsin n=1 Tax=Ilyodon furcidens TaxID=33524 RepID=A0ABV0ULF2_9TELE
MIILFKCSLAKYLCIKYTLYHVCLMVKVMLCTMKIYVCFREDQMMIVAGDYKVNIFEGTEQYAKPHRLVTHPLYNSSTNNADIMLIKLRAPMVLNKFVSLAPLPRQGTGVVEGHLCQVSGWGHNNVGGGQVPTELRTVTVPIVSAARCNSSDSFDGNITTNMICAGYQSGGKDACKV